MERNARLILVASFILLTALAAVIFSRWTQGTDADDMHDERLVQFEGSVSGLSIGSEVRYLGVAIGRVTSIALSPDYATRVDVGIGIQQRLPASEQLIALLEAQGITGLSVIELESRPPDAKVIVVAPGVIPGQPSLISQLSGSASRISAAVELTLARVNSLLDADSMADLDATLRQTRELTANLASASGQFEELLSSAGRVSRELEATTPDIRALVQRLDSEVLPSMTAAGQSLQAASTAMADSIGDNREELGQLLQQDLPTLIGITDELASSLQEFKRLVGNINSEPGALLYGEHVKEVEIDRE